MAESWQSPSPVAPFNVGPMLLLTDGSVLAQNEGTCLWWRLRPDRVGRYATGEWTRTGESASAPRRFAAAVMRDGAVFIAGGKYANNGTQPADLNTIERFDPVSGTWQSVRAPGWAKIGNAPCCVLPDGRLLLGSIKDKSCAVWNPKTRGWATTRPKRSASHGESWTLLPDGSVLAINCATPPTSERFFNDTWVADTPPPVDLADQASRIGPAMLLPDGTVLAIGATGATACFKPDADPTQKGAWAAGQSLPAAVDANGHPTGGLLGARGAAACLLPNGRVLCVAHAAAGVPAPAFLEFDLTDGWTTLPPPPGGIATGIGNVCFLLLPTGEVLISDGTPTLQLFKPDGAPSPAWAPGILNCDIEVRPGRMQKLTGTLFNGWSQACTRGGGSAVATNYPLVRLHATFPSDSLVYARTVHHSTMGVATGSAMIQTSFTVPRGTKPGIYGLRVVVNGIASPERQVHVRDLRDRAATHDQDAGSEIEEATFAEEELFSRDLAEVHLLMDFISGRADKALSGLDKLAGYEADGTPASELPAQRVIEDICRITYPPAGGQDANAQQASFILMVKDRLNQLAYPAKGLTVAFTSMFVGVALEYPKPSEYRPGPRKNRFFSAQAAYPNLETEARDFRGFYFRLPFYALVLALLILTVNWDIGVTSTALRQIQAADTDYLKLFTTGQFDPTIDQCSPAVVTLAHQPSCDAANTARLQQLAAERNLQDMLGGRALRPVALGIWLSGQVSTPNLIASSTDLKLMSTDAWIVRRTPLEAQALSVIDAFNSIVIPAAFGCLGTFAAVMRGIKGKVFDNTLAPRDRQLARVSLILGMVAGLSVGLYFNSTNAAVGQSLGSTITLSAASLSFMAGFGAEAFFIFLDTLVARLMPATPPSNAPPTATGAATH